MWIESGKKGLVFGFFWLLCVALPYLSVLIWTQKRMGAALAPAVTGKNDPDRGPRLLNYLQDPKNNYMRKKDFLGRRDAQFYKNWWAEGTGRAGWAASLSKRM